SAAVSSNANAWARSRAANGTSSRRYATRRTSSGLSTEATGASAPGSAPTAVSSSARSAAAVGRVEPRRPSVSARQCVGCLTRCSPSAREAPRTDSNRIAVPSSLTSSSIRSSVDTSARSDSARRARSGSPTRPKNATRSCAPSRSTVARAAVASAKPRRTSVEDRTVMRAASEDRKHPITLEGGHLATVVGPLGALVAQEEVEDVLTEGLRQQLGPLRDVDRVGQRPRQRVDPEAVSLLVGEGPDVVLGLGRELVPLLDALHPGREDDRVREVGVAGCVERADLDPGRLTLVRLVHRDAHHRRPVVVAPADVRGRLAPDEQPLVGVD